MGYEGDITMYYSFEDKKLICMSVVAGNPDDEVERDYIYDAWYKRVCATYGKSNSWVYSDYGYVCEHEYWLDDYTGYDLVNYTWGVRLFIKEKRSYLEEMKPYL